MLDVRSPLIAGAVPAGLVLAAASWLLLGAGASASNSLSSLIERSRASATVGAAGRTEAGLQGRSAIPSLFGLGADANAAVKLTVQLQGLSMARGRKAALVSIGGKPAIWLSLGETGDGVTLVDVSGDKVRIDTPTGFRELAFSDAATAPLSAAIAQPEQRPGLLPSAAAAGGFRRPS